MRPLTMQQILIRVVLVTAATTVMTYFFTDGDWYAVLLTVPLAAITSFGSVLISQRIASRIGPKPTPPPEPVVIESTTERPDHALRRRTRRQPRGRRP
ncbi:MAG: hypothetical protein DWI48_04620 [Chloroflexi bacterium]|nr:MAG: hypothetical protein DWI48_04620 [Chloroflexota bacterium]